MSLCGLGSPGFIRAQEGGDDGVGGFGGAAMAVVERRSQLG